LGFFGVLVGDPRGGGEEGGTMACVWGNLRNSLMIFV
jgi:hypothetical protein